MTATDAAREEWLSWRRQGIGASDIAGILGLSPWASPWSVWADKAGLLPDQPDNEYMAAGRWLEKAIGPWFEHETGLHVAGEQMWITHPAHDWVRSTPDGVVFEHPVGVEVTTFGEDEKQYTDAAGSLSVQGALGGLEIKVTGPGARWDEIPPHYQAQGQWQMLSTGWERVWFAVLMGRRLDIHELARDADDIAMMVARAEDFWLEHVLAGTPPPTDGHDATARALAAVYPEETRGVAVEVAATLVDELALAKQMAKEAVADEKAAGNAVRAALGDAEEGTVNGARVLSLRAQTRTAVCEHCHHETVSAPFRVLRTVKPKGGK